MGLFKRIQDIIGANFNDMIEGFEDPEQLLRQAVREMERAISQAKPEVARAMAEAKTTKKELLENEAQARTWAQRAETAVAAGDDDLARKALVRKKECERTAAALRDQHQAVAEAGQTLRRQLEAMQAKLADAERRLGTLVVRKRAADVRARAAGAKVADHVEAIATVEEVSAEAAARLGLADDGRSGPSGDPDTSPSVASVEKQCDTSHGPARRDRADSSPLPFAKLAHYEITGRVGRGGMGDVFQGYDPELERRVAIKVLPSEFAGDPDFVRRFRAEAAAAAKLNHPHVVQVYFIGEDAGCPCFAMQYVEGESLSMYHIGFRVMREMEPLARETVPAGTIRGSRMSTGQGRGGPKTSCPALETDRLRIPAGCANRGGAAPHAGEPLPLRPPAAPARPPAAPVRLLAAPVRLLAVPRLPSATAPPYPTETTSTALAPPSFAARVLGLPAPPGRPA